MIRPIFDLFDESAMSSLPPEARAAMSSMHVSFEEGVTELYRSYLTWVDRWWFAFLDGSGDIKIGAPKGFDYALLVFALGGRNRPEGKLENWLCPGEMALMQWPTQVRVISSGKFRYLIAHIPMDELRAALEGQALIFGEHQSICLGAGAAIYTLIRGIAEQLLLDGTRSSIAQILPEVALLIAKVFGEPSVFDRQTLNVDNRFARVIAYLEANLDDPSLNADLVAAMCGLSTRQLFRLFEGRESFASLLRRLRLEKARDILTLHPQIAISEVARLSGFISNSQLSRAFHAHIGCSPKQYRQHAVDDDV